MTHSGRLLIVLSLLVLATSMTPTGLAPAQQPTPTPAGFAMPVQPPPGWRATQWSNLRNFCIHIARKSQAHQPLTLRELQSRDLCPTYSPHMTQVPAGTAPSIPPPPVPPSALPTPMPTAVPEFPPQSDSGGNSAQVYSAASLLISQFRNAFAGGPNGLRFAASRVAAFAIQLQTPAPIAEKIRALEFVIDRPFEVAAS